MESDATKSPRLADAPGPAAGLSGMFGHTPQGSGAAGHLR